MTRTLYQYPLKTLTGGFWAPVVTRKHLLEGPGMVVVDSDSQAAFFSSSHDFTVHLPGRDPLYRTSTAQHVRAPTNPQTSPWARRRGPSRCPALRGSVAAHERVAGVGWARRVDVGTQDRVALGQGSRFGPFADHVAPVSVMDCLLKHKDRCWRGAGHGPGTCDSRLKVHPRIRTTIIMS